MFFIVFPFYNSWMGIFPLAIVVALTEFLLRGIALSGLYQKLPVASNPGRGAALVMILLSLLLSVVGLFVLPDAEFGLTLILAGYFGIDLGMAGLGIIGLKYGVMGVWRFAPFLLAIAWVGFIISFAQNYTIDSAIQILFSLLTGVGWLLLGLGLWQTEEEPTEPGLLA